MDRSFSYPQKRSAKSAKVLAVNSNSSTDTDSSAAWARRISPGPKRTVGVAPSRTNSRMSEPKVTPTTAGSLPSRSRRAPCEFPDNRILGRHLGRKEAPTPPLQLRWMVPEPGIDVPDPGQGSTKSLLGLPDSSSGASPYRPSTRTQSGTEDAQSPPSIFPTERGKGTR